MSYDIYPQNENLSEDSGQLIEECLDELSSISSYDESTRIIAANRISSRLWKLTELLAEQEKNDDDSNNYIITG